jgi:biopolymer transport protein ExbD
MVLVILFSVTATSISAQKSSDKVKSEITETQKIWNTACKNEDKNQVMALLDNTAEITINGINFDFILLVCLIRFCLKFQTLF